MISRCTFLALVLYQGLTTRFELSGHELASTSPQRETPRKDEDSQDMKMSEMDSQTVERYAASKESMSGLEDEIRTKGSTVQVVQQDIMNKLCVLGKGEKEEACLDYWRGCVIGSTKTKPNGGTELLKVIFQTKAGENELKFLKPSDLRLVKAFKESTGRGGGGGGGEIVPANEDGSERNHDGLRINSEFNRNFMGFPPQIVSVAREELGFQSGQKMIVNAERDGKSFVKLDKFAHYTTTMTLLGRERFNHLLMRNWFVPTSNTERLLAPCSSM